VSLPDAPNGSLRLTKVFATLADEFVKLTDAFVSSAGAC
jgi:hypothetical protein